MLSVVGPLAPPIAAVRDWLPVALPPVLVADHVQISTGYWFVALVFAVYAEVTEVRKLGAAALDVTYLPGNLGIDPLQLESPALLEAEILNGRIAMLAMSSLVIRVVATSMLQ